MQEMSAQTRYLELLLADLEHHFGGNAAYHHPQGHTSWSLPGACLCFPVSSSVQEVVAAAVQPQSIMAGGRGRARGGSKAKQTNRQGRETVEEVQQPNYPSLSEEMLKGLG